MRKPSVKFNYALSFAVVVYELHAWKYSFCRAEDKEEMEQCMADIKSNANKVRRKLRLIDKNIEDNSANTKQADLRIQKTQVCNLYYIFFFFNLLASLSRRFALYSLL